MDGEALARVVVESPEDETVRLVYADWLEENDRPLRAQFVRARGADVWPAFLNVDSELEATTGRALGLTATGRGHHDPQRQLPYLKYGWRSAGVPEDITLTFRNGFVEVIDCSGRVWVALGDTLLAGHPIRRVCLSALPQVRKNDCGWALDNDPQGKSFHESDVSACPRPTDPEPGDLEHWTAQFLRCRYAPRVAFEWPAARLRFARLRPGDVTAYFVPPVPEIELSGPDTIVGRSLAASVVVPHHFLSRRHTRFVWAGGAWWIEDLHSRNGTYVNCARIRSRARLRDRDEVCLAGLVYVFHEHP